MRVLSLVTNPDATFYINQTEALRDRGVEVDTFSVPGSRYGENGNMNHRTPIEYLRFYATAFRASFDDYDLLHASYGLTAPPAVVQPNLPTVLTLWGSDLMGRYGPVTGLCARFADEVVVMSPEMAERLGRPCHIIPHGIDTETFRPAPKSEARAELGWNSGEYRVLFPYSPDRPIKDFPRAERVVAAAERCLGEPIELRTVTGVPHRQMPTYMNASDALLLTSRREGTPNSVKEALACNLPVVATDVGDVATQLRDVEPSVVGRTDEELVDGLVAVLSRDERSNGRVMIEGIRLDVQVDRLHEIYRRLVDADTDERALPKI